MQIGMIGLGRMGGNIVRRLMGGGHSAVVYDRDPKAAQPLGWRGRRRSRRSCRFRRAVGEVQQRGVGDAAGGRDHRSHRRGAGKADVEAGDILIDGGNSLLPRRHQPGGGLLKATRHPLSWMSARQRRRMGTGTRLLHDDRRRQGKRLRAFLDPIFKTLAPGSRLDRHARPDARDNDHRRSRRVISIADRSAQDISAKMVHNGIEITGVMQAYAEGFDILKGRNSGGGAGRSER